MTSENKQWFSQLLIDLDTLGNNDKLKLDINKFQPVQVVVDNQILNQQELSETLAKIGQVTGWLQATSEVKTLHDELIQANSTLLSGEWIGKDNMSYQLEYMGNYQWVLQSAHIIEIKEDNMSQANANNVYLAEKITHLKVQQRKQDKHKPQKLIYQKLWGLKNNAPVADKAFFIGFE